MAACHGSMLAMQACTPASPSDLGSDAGLRAFRGKPFPALGELGVFAFAVAGFLADNLVDLGAFAAGTTERAGWTLEGGIAAPTVIDSRPARTPRTGCGSRPNAAIPLRGDLQEGGTRAQRASRFWPEMLTARSGARRRGLHAAP